MFEFNKQSTKTQAELLEEHNELMKELKRLDKEMKCNQDLERLLRMAIDAQKSGKEGFYIPPDLVYLQDELQEILEFGEKIIPYDDKAQGLVS